MPLIGYSPFVSGSLAWWNDASVTFAHLQPQSHIESFLHKRLPWPTLDSRAGEWKTFYGANAAKDALGVAVVDTIKESL
jgi:hypothetical protein